MEKRSPWFMRSLLPALLSVSCSGPPTDLIVAPTGSKIQLTVNPNEIGVEGEGAQLTAIVLDDDGRPVGSRTNVVFSVTRGGLCDGDSTCTWDKSRGAITVVTRDGIASARFVSGPTAGDALVTVSSGETAAVTATIKLTHAVAPVGTKAVLQVRPDTLSVSKPGTFQGYWYLPTQAPVADGTRIVLLSDSVRIGTPILRTAGGFAETTLTPPATPGQWKVYITSGAYRDSVTVVSK